MPIFQQINAEENLKKIVKSAFDTDMEISGAWGYTQASATCLEGNPDHLPVAQIEHMLASMRAYLEMNMTLEKEKRYGSININEIFREQLRTEEHTYDKVNYEITAMQEEDYTSFINEYKEGYGKEDFDLNDHFQRRKEATITRSVIHWFEIGKVI